MPKAAWFDIIRPETNITARRREPMGAKTAKTRGSRRRLPARFCKIMFKSSSNFSSGIHHLKLNKQIDSTGRLLSTQHVSWSFATSGLW